MKCNKYEGGDISPWDNSNDNNNLLFKSTRYGHNNHKSIGTVR
jgi:hypothetical protein